MSAHERTIGKSQSWITPKWVIDELGPFDLDPCSCVPQPWPCAKINYTENGLEQPWFGRVWLNPPFDHRFIANWMKKLALHKQGIALVHARVDTQWFGICWEFASAILFLQGRMTFHTPDGVAANTNSGAPVCFVAFSEEDARRLEQSKIPGFLVTHWSLP